MVDALIVMNNYFNDLAVAMVFVSALFSFYALRRAGSDAASSVIAAEVSRKFTPVFYVSLAAFVLGAAVRIWSMPEFELSDAERNGQMLPLKVKYVFLLSLVGAGVVLKVFSRQGTPAR